VAGALFGSFVGGLWPIVRDVFATDLFGFPSWTSGEIVGELFDAASDRLLVIARPAAQPDLWAAYLHGARLSYAQHGVESAVDYDHVRDGDSTSLFVAAVESDGRVVGGLRVQGPYTRVDQADALREWAGRAGTTELRRQIGRRLADGVVEVKAVWVDRDAGRHDALTAVLARMFVHLPTLMDVRYAFCTAASHAVPRWESSGGVVCAQVAPVAYPDERYRTLLMWWDRQTVVTGMAGGQARAVLQESARLHRPAAVSTGSPWVA
jgi:hypothetical protein